MDSGILSYVLVTIIIAILGYLYLIDSIPDVDPSFVSAQSSVSSTRRPGETAVFRSQLVPHGLKGLVTGLQIQGGQATESSSVYGRPKTRDGTIEDLWTLLKQADGISTFALGGRGGYETTHVSFGTMEKWVLSLGLWMTTAVGGGDDSPARRAVAIAHPNSIEAFVAIFAAALFGFQAVILPANSELPNAIDTVNAAILITSGEILDQVAEDAQHSLSAKHIVSTGRASAASSARFTLTKWSDVISSGDNMTALPERPKFNDQVPPLGFVTTPVSGTPELVSVSNQGIVSSIAAQLKVLNETDRWKPSDTVLSCTSELSRHAVLHNLAAIVAGARLVVPEMLSSVNLFEVVKSLEPTVLILDDISSESLASRADRLKALNLIKVQIALATLSRHKLPRYSYVLKQFAPVRLIHSGGEYDDLVMDTKVANKVRALTGSYLIHSFYVGNAFGPVAQTVPYDYRDDQLVIVGAPLPNVEVMLADHEGHEAAKKQGQLWIRGPIITSKPQWVNTKVIGALGDDGALRVRVQ